MKFPFKKNMRVIFLILFPLAILALIVVITYTSISTHEIMDSYTFYCTLTLFVVTSVSLIIDFFNTSKFEKERKEVKEYYDIAKEAILNNEKELSTELLSSGSVSPESPLYSKKFLGHSNMKLSKNSEENNKQIKNSSHTPKNRKSKEFDDILQMMLLNMREIKEYYVLSKNMAKRSFNLAVAMCVLGFLAIASSIISLFLTDVNFIEALIPIIGGTIVELIAGTTLVVYKKSLEQLNKYYDALHNNERFLSVVNLVDKLSDNKKDEVYINIINNQLQTLNNINNIDHTESK